MNVVEINGVDIGSTGNIMFGIAEQARKSFYPVLTISSRWHGLKKENANAKNVNHFYVNHFFSNLIHYFLGRVCGLNGLGSFFSTFLLLRCLKKNNVQLVHLHNLHNFCFNLPLLFHFIKKNDIFVVWTLHDCWNFTGRCPHFVLTKCDKWKKECCCCPYPRASYPQSLIDTTRIMWNLKRQCFTGVNRLIIVTPSRWLANLAKQSFLKDYPIRVINNGIDLSVFHPIESDFRARYGLVDVKIVLGVAFGWGYRKGLDVFVELSKRLPHDYRIVLVGTDDRVDAILPANIISIHRTQNQTKLAEIYTAVNVFANPTREDTFPTVNIESLACGTPVITFKTGGSPEIIDETCGSVVPYDDIDAMEMAVRHVCEKNDYSSEACIKRAELFEMNAKYEEYVELYREFEK